MRLYSKPFLWIAFFSLSAFLISSCSKNSETFSTEDTETSNNESTQESTTSELDDMATAVLDGSLEAGALGGRSVSFVDDRFACEGTEVLWLYVNAEKTEGKAVVTFGPNGCTDKKGNVRKGVMKISWSGGRWFKEGSSVTIILENYSINDVKITGYRTTTCKGFTASPLTVTWLLTANHTATWPDGTTATRRINKTRKWEHSTTEDKFTVTNGPTAVNAAEGVNRHGKEYKVYITSPLVYLGSCAKSSKVYIPVKGEKVITHVSSSGKTKSLSINYGNGTCDNTYTVTSGALVKTLTCKNDSSND